MNFEFELEDWHFHIALTQTPDYRPDSKFTHVSSAEKTLWEEGKLSFYSLILTSRILDKNHPHQEELIHYACGVLLPDEEEALSADLETILDQEGLIDHVLKHWELLEDCEGPDWK